MSDLNESGINDPAMPNSQNEGAFNNPGLDRGYQGTFNKNMPAARRLQITRAVRERLNSSEICEQCEGTGHYKGQDCPGCKGDGRIAPQDATLD